MNYLCRINFSEDWKHLTITYPTIYWAASCRLSCCFPWCSSRVAAAPTVTIRGFGISARSSPTGRCRPPRRLRSSTPSKRSPDTDLSEGERHYRDFLTIKASDKGYVKHTYDSLYLTVKDYFSSHHSREMLPEVLYYGGRVYSDMGNYPVALQYFQEVLDGMEGRQENLYLKRCVLSQTGRLLSKLGIFPIGGKSWHINSWEILYRLRCLTR